MSKTITSTKTITRLELTKKQDSSSKDARKRATRVKRVQPKRWSTLPSYNKLHHARRQNLKKMDKTPKRMKNKTLNKRRHHFYTQGEGQQGLGITNARATNNIRQQLAMSTRELQGILSNDLHQGHWYVYTDFIEPVRAALDAYINELLYTAHMIASGRQPGAVEEVEEGDSDKPKRKRKTRGLKCRRDDLQKAINMICRQNK